MNVQELTQFQEFIAAVQKYIGRELSAPEAIALVGYFPSLKGSSGVSANSDLVTEARLRAAQALNEGRQRVDESMTNTLQILGAVPAGAVAAQEGGVVKLINQAGSLAQLSAAGANATASGAQQQIPGVMGQIAERLMVLVKAEVERGIETRFAPLNEQISAAVQQLSDWVGTQKACATAATDAPTATSAPTPSETAATSANAVASKSQKT